MSFAVYQKLEREVRIMTDFRRGFSLIELLVVMGIIALLSTAAIVGFQSIASSRGVGQAAADVNGILELARSEAIARQTYVWVAFREEDAGAGLEIQMLLLASIDGSANADGGNLMPLTRVVRSRGAGMINWSELNPRTQDILGSLLNPVDILDNADGIDYAGSSQRQFSKTTITFTPGGEALLLGEPLITSGFTPLISVGVVAARGSEKATGKNDDAAVIVDGSTGLVRVLRVTL